MASTGTSEDQPPESSTNDTGPGPTEHAGPDGSNPNRLADTEGADESSSAASPPAEPPLPFHQGDIAEGTAIKVDNEGVIVDLGTWIEGFIAGRELTRSQQSPPEIVTVGEPVRGLVTTEQGPDGRPRISPLRLESEKAWHGIEETLAGDGVLEAKVVEAVKGGLRLDAGVDAFLPASLIELHPVSDLTPYVGRDIKAKIIESDRRRYKVVLSRRALLEEERRKQAAEVFEKLHEGDIVTGKVASVTDIGAFVDLGGADGLVHITELSWSRVSNAGDVVKPGDEVDVKVLKLEPERERISLSLREAKGHPWEDFVRSHRDGEVVSGKVTKTVDFGAFVEVAEGVEGLVHISELAPHRVEKTDDVLSRGDDVQARILEIDVARRRLSLSIRAVDEPEGDRRAPRGRGGGGQRGGRGGKRGGRAYSAGEENRGGLSSAISSDSLDALSQLKEQLEESDTEQGSD